MAEISHKLGKQIINNNKHGWIQLLVQLSGWQYRSDDQS